MTNQSEFPAFVVGMASDLREKAFKVRDKVRANNTINNVFSKMEDAANRGEFHITFKLYEIDDDILIDLQHLGYVIEYNYVQREANYITNTFNTTDTEVIISWDMML